MERRAVEGGSIVRAVLVGAGGQWALRRDLTWVVGLLRLAYPGINSPQIIVLCNRARSPIVAVPTTEPRGSPATGGGVGTQSGGVYAMAGLQSNQHGK